nr:MAG: phosphomannomutase [Bacteroidota bacterium]
MRPAVIRFGTDGWRAVMAAEYTFDNVGRLALGTARWLQEQGLASHGVVVGYDTRFLSDRFARHVALVLASQDIPVVLSDDFLPTPALSWATQHYGAALGVMITASHNPPEYNGYKLKASFGGPALPETISAIESRIPPEPPEALPDPERLRTRIRLSPIREQFLELLRQRVNLEEIQRSGLRVLYDAMYGAGQGALRRLLGPMVREIRATYNPGFDRQAPEPIEKHLVELCRLVRQEGYDLGLATDGDADRIALVDEKGRFVDSHKILALLVRYLYEERGLRGDIVKTFSVTHMLDRMGSRYGLRVHTTPIGFKYVVRHFLEGDVLVGGEESGGLAIKGHIPERDGLFIGLTILEMLARLRRPLSVLIDELQRDFGPLYNQRIDVHTTEAQKAALLERIRQEGLRMLAGQRVIAVQDLDGYKHLLEDGSWLLIRASGTEPVLRFYSEASSLERARELVEAGAGLLEDLPVAP